MQIAIIELDTITHYPSIVSVIKVYQKKFEHSLDLVLDIYAPPSILEQVSSLIEMKRVKLLPIDTNFNFLDQLNEDCIKNKYQRIHLNTISYSKLLLRKLNFEVEIFAGLHSTENIFNVSFISALKIGLRHINLRLDRLLLKKTCHHLPKIIEEQILRKRLIKRCLNKGKIIVFGSHTYKSLLTFVDPEKACFIPFYLFDEKVVKTTIKTIDTKINIVVPGTISQQRRDYISLLKELIKKIEYFQDKVEFVFLGFFCSNNDEEIATINQLINQYKSLGGNIQYFKDFVEENDYNNYLTNCDLILGNLNIDSSYGINKETGVVYNMIRAAKPGILPIEFVNLEELKSSTLTFNSYEHLTQLLIMLLKNPLELESFKENAMVNSQKFLPEKFIDQL